MDKLGKIGAVLFFVGTAILLVATIKAYWTNPDSFHQKRYDNQGNVIPRNQ